MKQNLIWLLLCLTVILAPVLTKHVGPAPEPANTPKKGVKIKAIKASATATATGESARETLSKDEDRSEIIGEIEDIAASSDSTYGVYVLEIDTGAGFGFNEDRQYPAASTIKVPVLAGLYLELERGAIDRDQIWTYTEPDYETGTGSIQYEDTETTHTVGELVEKMIKESDNVATKIILRNLGRQKIRDLLNESGVKGIDWRRKTSSPRGMAEFLTLIYQHEIVGEKSGQEMIELMTETEFEQRLPRYLPDGVRVAHKIGTKINAISDVGIVFLEGKPFIISVYSGDVSDIEETEDTIGKICRRVYDFELSRH